MKQLDLIDVSTKIIIGFFLLFLITKMLGKTTIKQLTPFDFVSAIVLSELLGNAIYEKNVTLFYIAYSIFLWGGLLILMEKILLKFRKLRGFWEGNPSIIIRKGNIDRKELQKNRMNVNQLMSLLRQNKVFSVREVEYAVLEPNGSISVLKKPQHQSVTLNDLKLQGNPAQLPTSLILDGEVLKDHLSEIGYDEEWLQKQIFIFGVTDVKDVLYADWLPGQGIYVVPKND